MGLVGTLQDNARGTTGKQRSAPRLRFDPTCNLQIVSYNKYQVGRDFPLHDQPRLYPLCKPVHSLHLPRCIQAHVCCPKAASAPHQCATHAASQTRTVERWT